MAILVYPLTGLVCCLKKRFKQFFYVFWGHSNTLIFNFNSENSFSITIVYSAPANDSYCLANWREFYRILDKIY